ncbi:uncharacterized protein LOC123658301 [Melitaea cinxia]|uniref:uncharacterized protein LOC123658301 n=1 Tax=Melitaea cinxia TaxID=113334 RepID=UPI001E270B10|nr:uncharacterized protein LOC123658301 [Melitaea cinxia]
MAYTRAAPTLLLHTNLLLMLFAGAILSTAARLKWDPTVYVVARELFPMEYRSAAAVLTTAGFTMLLLAQLALVALSSTRPDLRRGLLILFAAVTAVVLWCEAAWVGWLTLRILRWTRGAPAAEMRHAVQVTDHLGPLLEHLAYYNPLPEKVHQIIREAKADLPHNLYVLGCAAGIMVVLQAMSAVLALLAARGTKRLRAPSIAYSTVTTTTPLRRGGAEKAPLRAVYRNGRLEVL